MKTKFLSIILALSMLCMVCSASVISLASTDAVDIGDSVTITQARLQSATGVSFARNQSGIAGKNIADTIQIIDVASDASSITGTAGSYPRYEITHGLNFASNKISTFQFNIYADANVVAGFTFHWSDVLVWNADGTLQYKYYKSDSEKTAIANAGSLERGRWHTIALTYDYDADIQHIYADGELIASCKRAGGYVSSTVGSHTSMRIGAYSGSKEGRIAIDNVFAYAGSYVPSDDTVSLKTPDSKLIVDEETKTIICASDAFADVQSFNLAVAAAFDAKSATLYDDANFATPSDVFGYGYVVINTKNGVGYDYYKVSDGTVFGEDFDDGVIDTTKQNIETWYSSYATSYSGILGGKSADDKALVISLDGKNVKTAGSSTPDIDLHKDNRNGYSDDTVTFEVDIYKDNTTVPVYAYVYYDNSQSNAIAVFNNHGSILVNGKIAMAYTPNRWYKVAATYTKADNTMKVYINGKLADSYTLNASVIGNRFRVMAQYSVTTITAEDNTKTYEVAQGQYQTKFAVDNYRISLTPYDGKSDTAAVTANENFKFKDNTFFAKNMYDMSKSEILEAVSASSNVEIYSDGTYETALSDNEKITESSVMVSVSSNGKVREYYSFSEGEINNIAYVIKDGNADAAVYATIPNGEDYMFILAKYNGENELLAIDIKESLVFGDYTSLTLHAEAGCTYKVFLWSDTMVPVEYAEFK